METQPVLAVTSRASEYQSPYQSNTRQDLDCHTPSTEDAKPSPGRDGTAIQANEARRLIAAVILVTTALRPSRPRRRPAALRSRNLDHLVRREVGPACAQRAAMLISGGGLSFAEPPASGKRSTPGGTDLCFSPPADTSGPSQSATKRNEWRRLLQNASKCSETFRNALLGMTYCLGNPAFAASRGLIGNQHPFCKTMQSSA